MDIQSRTVSQNTAKTSSDNVSLNDIAMALCSATGFEVSDLSARTRQQEYVDVRHVFSVLGRQYGFTYQQIGDFLDRGHDSVLSLVNSRMLSDGQDRMILEARHMLEGDLYYWAQKLASYPDDSYIQNKVVELIQIKSE